VEAMMIAIRMASAILVIALGAASAWADDIVDDGGFANGLDEWTTSQSGAGTHTIEVLSSYESYSDVLHLKRTGSGNDGGGQRVTQTFSTPPNQCIAGTVKVSARLKIVSHTLTNSGWWSTMNGGIGEYPLRFKISSASTVVWNMGLMGYSNSEPLTNYYQVPLNTWVEGSLTVPLEHYGLTKLEITADGWDWDVYLDYVKVEPTP
jgi:hypothetical protein